MEQVKFYYCKTALPETLIEGGIYFVEPEGRIYKIENGEAVDFNPNGDWNVNDESLASYIKNRTHWKEDIEEVIYKTADKISIDSYGNATFIKSSGSGRFALEQIITAENDKSDGITWMDELLYSFTDNDGNEHSGTLKNVSTKMNGCFISITWEDDVFSYTSSSEIKYNFKQFLGQTIKNFTLKSPTVIYHQIDDKYLKPIEEVSVEHGHYEEIEIEEVREWTDLEFTVNLPDQ